MLEIPTKKALDIVTVINNAVGKRNVIPIMEYINVQIKDKQIYIVATDSVKTIHYNGKVDAPDCNLVIDAQRLISLLKATTKKKVKFTHKDDILEMQGNGKYKLHTVTDEYPDPAVKIAGDVEKVKTDTLIGAMETTSQTVERETQIATSVLSGYKMGAETVTTDSYTVSQNKKKVFDTHDVVIPQHSEGILKDLKSAGVEELEAHVKDSFIFLVGGGFTVTMALLDGKIFPNVTPLMDGVKPGKFTVKTSDLKEASRRLQIAGDPMAGEEIIRLDIEKKGAKLIIKDAQGRATEEITGTDAKLEDFTLALSQYNLEKILKSLKVTEVDIMLPEQDVGLMIQNGDTKHLIVKIQK